MGKQKILLVYTPASQNLIDFMTTIMNRQKVLSKTLLKPSLNNLHIPRCLTSEEINEPGPHAERHERTDFVTSWKKIELHDVESVDELQINILTRNVKKHNSEKRKPTWHHCKKTGH